MRALAWLILLLAAPVLHAQQMYKCTEAGKTRYSDKPITDCKSATTIAPPPPAASSGPAGPAAAPPGRTPPKIPAKFAPKGTAKDALKAAQRAPQQTAKAPQTEHDKKYASAQCRELREEEAWLRSPRGTKVERRDERLDQIRKGLTGCR